MPFDLTVQGRFRSAVDVSTFSGVSDAPPTSFNLEVGGSEAILRRGVSFETPQQRKSHLLAYKYASFLKSFIDLVIIDVKTTKEYFVFIFR